MMRCEGNQQHNLITLVCVGCKVLGLLSSTCLACTGSVYVLVHGVEYCNMNGMGIIVMCIELKIL